MKENRETAPGRGQRPGTGTRVGCSQGIHVYIIYIYIIAAYTYFSFNYTSGGLDSTLK